MNESFGSGVVKRQCAFFIVAVNADAVGDGAVQCSGFIIVLGCEALLKPVVKVEAPGSVTLPQLIKAA